MCVCVYIYIYIYIHTHTHTLLYLLEHVLFLKMPGERQDKYFYPRTANKLTLWEYHYNAKMVLSCFQRF